MLVILRTAECRWVVDGLGVLTYACVLDLFCFVRAGGQASNPAQVAQMLQGLTPAERAQMAAAMGVSPQQLAQVKDGPCIVHGPCIAMRMTYMTKAACRTLANL